MEKIYDKNLVDEYKTYSTIYGTEVNFRRMIPDVRDGLKLVQRRILHCMVNKLPCDTRAVKTVAVVGETIKIHPHGDSSIGGAIKILTNWFDIKEPLISSSSNMGNMQGGGAAAPRYTEVKLSNFCLDCLVGELKQSKDIVDWVPTFDNTDKEPEYLPEAVPLLLINGTSGGIAFGLKVEIPRHNITEVLDATINLIKHPNAPVVLIPDHCMPCEIIDTNWKSISNKGFGQYYVRGVIDIEKDSKGLYSLVIKSTPDGVSSDKGSEETGGIRYDILKMIKNGKLPQIIKMTDNSKGTDMKIVIRLRRGSDPNYVREFLYKTTDLQVKKRVNFQVLCGLDLDRYSYRSYLQFFIEHRKLTKFRLYCSKLRYVRTKIHERDAYIKIIESGEIDNIISMIKKQKTIDDDKVMEYIISHTNVTDIQARFIMNTNVKNLSLAYLNKYKEDLKNLLIKEKEYLDIITNDDLILKEILSELEFFKKKYGKPRVCKVISTQEVNNIPSGEFKVIISDDGHIKKTSVNEPMNSKNSSDPLHVFKIDNSDNILLFTELGKVYKLPVSKIPIADKNSVGFDLRLIVNKISSTIVKVIKESEIVDLSKRTTKYFLVISTLNNTIKKIDLEDISNVTGSGIIYTKLNDGDLVKDIAIVSNRLDVIIYSDKKALRINMEDIPHYKRQSKGVIAMNTTTSIDGIEPLYRDAKYIVIITKNGKANKFDISGMNVSNRSKSGNSVINLSRGDSIFRIFGVNNNNVIRVITKNQKLDIKVSDIKIGSSISSGIKIIPTRGDIILRCDVYKES